MVHTLVILYDHYEFSLLSLLSENLQVHKVCPSISRITTMAELRQLEFVTSPRGTPQILLGGFMYSKSTTRQTAQPDRHNQTDSTARQTQPDRQHSQTDSTTRQTAQHWRCVNKTCKGKCTSRSPKQHRCTRCTTTMCQQKIPLIYRHYPPLACCMSSALYRHRRKTIPVLPQTRAEVDLEDDWTRTTDDERFLLLSKGEENKILAFSTDQQLRALQAAETVYMDGTFSSCPALWDDYIQETVQAAQEPRARKTSARTCTSSHASGLRNCRHPSYSRRVSQC